MPCCCAAAEMQSDDDQQAAEDEETEQSDDEISDDDQMVEDDHDDDEDDVDQQQLENAQQAAAEAVIDLAQEFQHQAGILAMDPAQQVLAGGAFQQVVAQVLLPALAHLHGPGAADAAAAVAPVQEVAAELAQGAIPWLNPAGAVAALQNALHAAAAGQQQQQQQQQAPVIPYAGMYGLRHHPFEPHLHFLGSMTQLGESAERAVLFVKQGRLCIPVALITRSSQAASGLCNQMRVQSPGHSRQAESST